MLDFIYYPVSFILWCWHWVFSHIFGEASGFAWVLGIMFLTFTVRAIMFKPFVKQVRSMRKMQEFAPEIKKLQKKYANDKQKLAQEMQKLQSQHGVNPLGGCLPMLLQIPVFIGLNHVLRMFAPGKHENYFFDAKGVESYVSADVFGARLSNYIAQGSSELAQFGVERVSVVLVSVPLMIVASFATHLTARHSVARQNPAAATAQTGMMNKLTLYVFPLGVLAFGAFFPIGLLLYWLSNNAWTLMQQHIVYRKIDQEEEEKKTAVVEKRNALGPKVGQKPTQTKKRPPQPKQAADGSAESADGSADSADSSSTSAKPDSSASPKTPKTSRTSKSAASKPTASNGGARDRTSKAASGKSDDGGTEIPGLLADRSRSKKTGRKRS